MNSGNSKNIVIIANGFIPYDMFFNACKANNDLTFPVYPAWPFNSSNFFATKVFRKIFSILAFSCMLDFFWKIPLKTIENCSSIIIHDGLPFCLLLLRIISRRFKNKKLIIYYFNKICDWNKRIYDYCKKIKCEQWSFDEKDCLRYNLNYNKTFIFATNVNAFFQKNTIDVFFFGASKERTEKIAKASQILKRLNLSVDIRIADKKSEYIPYVKVCEYVQKSLAILDISINGQYGPTQREMEALFYRKKLITTNEAVKDRDYYNENNIYYLDLNKSEHDDLVDFLRKPYLEIDESIIESYSYNAWVGRFFEGEKNDKL